MQAAFWPARFGHSGLTLLPLTPWQAVHTAAALVAPASAEPVTLAGEVTASSAVAVEVTANPARTSPAHSCLATDFMENRLSIMILRAPWKAPNCTLDRKSVV